MMKVIKRTIKYLLAAFLIFIIAANSALFITKTVKKDNKASILGYSWAVIMSGSMEPSIHAGDLAVTKKQDDYSTGDIVTFEKKETDYLITHRIARKNSGSYETRGDSNNVNDSGTIEKEDIVGKVVLIIPKVGFVIRFLKTPLGIALLAVSGIFIMEWPSWKERKDMQKRR